MEETLKLFGITTEEANIYITLLKKGPQKVTQLAKLLAKPRSTLYDHLARLHEQGLVIEHIESFTKTFKATPPSQLPKLFEHRMNEMQEIVPKLEHINNNEPHTIQAQLHRGKEGIKIVMDDIIQTGKNYKTFGDIESFFSAVEIYTHQWMKKIDQTKIKGKLLATHKQKFAVAKSEEVKFLPKEITINTTTVTYGTKTAEFIWTQPLTIIVTDSKELTRSKEEVFNYFWRISSTLK
jgi:sugar-specific transcriptional regulator TrmB